MPASESVKEVTEDTAGARLPLRPETREAFMKALEGLRSAGASVIFDDTILPDTFAVTVARVGTSPYVREGTERFLAEYGPTQYHSADEYQRAVGSPLPATIIGGKDETSRKDREPLTKAVFETDPQAEANVLAPRQRALDAYNEVLDRIGYTSTGSSTRRHRCLHPMRPCRGTGGLVKVRTVTLDVST